MYRYLSRILILIVFGFALLAGALVYWQIIRAPQLLARFDNPRPYEEKLREPRGRILDAKRRILVESIPAEGQFHRQYHYPPLVHVTGFDSAHYGNSGVEASYDAYLSGKAGRSDLSLWWDKMLHRHSPINDVILTIDLDIQMKADELLGDRKGAVALLEIDSGHLVALVSHPYFDPNSLEQEWAALNSDADRPFWGRAAQGLYSPGSCLGPSRLLKNLRDFALEETLPVEIESSAGQFPPQDSLSREELALLANGQGQFAITPLHMALIMSAIGRDGTMPVPHLVKSVISEQETLLFQTQPEVLARPISIQVAAELRDIMSSDVSEDITSLVLCTPVAKSGMTELTSDIPPHSILMGFAPLDDPRYAISVVIENGGRDEKEIRTIAQQVLRVALEIRQ